MSSSVTIRHNEEGIANKFNMHGQYAWFSKSVPTKAWLEYHSVNKTATDIRRLNEVLPKRYNTTKSPMDKQTK